MMILIKPLHNLLLFFSSVFFIAAFFTLRKTLDIHLHDTMFVIGFAHIFMFAAVYFALLWLLYTFTKKNIWSEKLYRVHILLSVILVSVIIAAALWSNPVLEAYINDDLHRRATLAAEIGNVIVGALLTLTTVQLLYPLNLIIGLVKHKKH